MLHRPHLEFQAIRLARFNGKCPGCGIKYKTEQAEVVWRESAETQYSYPGVPGWEYPSRTRRTRGKFKCPCQRLVAVGLVKGTESTKLCNEVCMSACGPSCRCSCGGENHGIGGVVLMIQEVTK